MKNNDLLTSKKHEWEAILNHLNTWYYKPDTDALLIALSTYVSHFTLTENAVWTFIIGPSGTGKTQIACAALECLPSTTSISDLSTNAFVSGLPGKKGGNSLLHNLQKIGKDPTQTHGVLIFKDFTSIISKRPEVKAELMGQLRQIWDGHFHSIKGTKTIEWKGKVTIIAAVTPAIERAWAVQRELGERFVQVRWPREDGIETANYAGKHIDNVNITKDFQTKIKQFVDISTVMDTKVELPSILDFSYAAEIAAILRGTVIRDTTGIRTIIDVPQFEAPTRLVKSMILIAMNHARLFRRNECNIVDINIGKRIAIDSIPISRLKIINSIIEGINTPSGMISKTGLQYSSIEWVCDELIALGAIQSLTDNKVTKYQFQPKFNEYIQKALHGYSNILAFPEKTTQG
jgi:hypothetical protein